MSPFKHPLICTFALLAAALCSAPSTHAATLFSDDFSEANGTGLDGKLPDVGGAPWDQTVGGALSVDSGSGGRINTAGGARVAFGFFTGSLDAGEKLVLDFDLDNIGNFHSGGFAGLSLFEGGTERIFVGDGGAATTWVVSESGVGTDTSGIARSNTNGRFTYDFDSGNYSLSLDGDGAVTGQIAAGISPDRIRFANNGGGDIIINSIDAFDSSNVRTPEGVVFQDNFDVSAGPIGSVSPQNGTFWHQSVGAPVPTNGSTLDTTGAAREIFGVFNGSLAAHETAIIEFNTNSKGNFHSNGFAGFSLFDGDTEKIFFGDLNGASTTWGVLESGVGGVASGVAGSNQDNGKFIYAFDTGEFQLLFDDVLALSGTLSAGITFDRIRIANDFGGDIIVDDLKVSLVTIVPEPTTGLLLGLASMGLARRRRRSIA